MNFSEILREVSIKTRNRRLYLRMIFFPDMNAGIYFHFPQQCGCALRVTYRPSAKLTATENPVVTDHMSQ